MNPIWYLNRLKKMSIAEIFKRFFEYIYIYASRIKFADPEKWPYDRFAGQMDSVYRKLPYTAIESDYKHHRIYNHVFDLTAPINWHFSNLVRKQWPIIHYSKIDYRPGNPYGDVRINWELNRLQFLPFIAIANGELARSILLDWLHKNPYQQGPAYLSAMEVAIRWMSVYRTASILGQKTDKLLNRKLTGLAIVSGKFIEKHLSTHSSAGNHLIVEAVGLFWIGRALEKYNLGQRLLRKSRKILPAQICRQINPDGTNKEQTLWYLSFVLDAVFHYFLLEDQEQIPRKVKQRIGKSVQLLHEITAGQHQFPDYGDRDDGYIFHLPNQYNKLPFSGLLSIGALYFKNDQWRRSDRLACQRLSFWEPKGQPAIEPMDAEPGSSVESDLYIKTFPSGGMTWMKQGKGKLLFRHAPLGLGNTYGHGHADALSIILYWDDVPLLLDLGSGQYNGDQAIRDFFRSTIAHNTVEIEGQDQANMLGPFMWDKTYNTTLTAAGVVPHVFAEAEHDGYLKSHSLVHKRRIDWIAADLITIEDAFSGKTSVKMRGAFHLGPCKAVKTNNHRIEVDFGSVAMSFQFPLDFLLKVYYGSEDPFMGWRSTVYGRWEPIHSIVYSTEFKGNYNYTTTLQIIDLGSGRPKQ